MPDPATAALALSAILGATPIIENTDELFALWRDGDVRNVHGVAIGESTTASVNWNNLGPQIFEAVQLALARGCGGLSGVGVKPPLTFVAPNIEEQYRFHLPPIAASDSVNNDWLNLDVSDPLFTPYAMGVAATPWSLGVHHATNKSLIASDSSFIVSLREADRFVDFPYQLHTNDAVVDSWRLFVGAPAGSPGGTYLVETRPIGDTVHVATSEWAEAGTITVTPGQPLAVYDTLAAGPTDAVRVRALDESASGLVVAHLSGASAAPGHRLGLYAYPGQRVEAVTNPDAIAAQQLVLATEQPDWFAVNFGINDASAGTEPAVFLAEMASVLDRLAAAAPDAIPVVISSPLAPTTLQSFPEKTALQSAYNAGLRDLARDRGWAWIDVDRIMRQAPSGFAGVHLSISGMRFLADQIELLATGAITPTPCEADANGDGTTDVFDFAALAEKFGASVTPSVGADFNGDGTVDVFDFAALADEFGCGAGAD